MEERVINADEASAADCAQCAPALKMNTRVTNTDTGFGCGCWTVRGMTRAWLLGKTRLAVARARMHRPFYRRDGEGYDREKECVVSGP